MVRPSKTACGTSAEKGHEYVSLRLGESGSPGTVPHCVTRGREGEVRDGVQTKNVVCNPHVHKQPAIALEMRAEVWGRSRYSRPAPRQRFQSWEGTSRLSPRH